MCTVFGIGYGPLSDSSAYSIRTFDFGGAFDTTSNGMPIGPPSHWPEPKSGWRPVEPPIEAMICAESAATGSVSTRWFHGLFTGKTGHAGAEGARGAAAGAGRGGRAARTGR